MGWIALEELKWGDADHKWIRPGNLYTCGPGSYKIPSVNDIPLNFKVALLKVNTWLLHLDYYVLHHLVSLFKLTASTHFASLD